jgi:putative nucleotidyltransferase with HDIG domain
MTAEEIVAQAKDLPVVSETARKLTIQLNQPDLHRDELVKTLRCDNVLTAKLLRACNSAECGAREPVISLDQALLILGDDTIFRMVCAIGFGDSLGMSTPGYAAEANGLWNHSLSTGVGAEYLAGVENYGDGPASAAFTAGLLHDIGKTVINKVLTPKARADIRLIIAGQMLTRAEAEKSVLGADHSEVGACLLKRWLLPEPIVEAVANHHSPVVKPSVQLSAVVYLANCSAHLCGATQGWETHIAQVNQKSSELLGMDVKEIERLVAAVQNAMQTLPQLKAAA